ncbi:carbohydrate esterase family 1 protein [Athelia psychrophila]|uniref:feruloyl esterase n=1 Tax=Athelia psychrophila TaxID=1759441 RepID=A0A165WPE4_9AGAM|nr:carbohydrate esterase family 1 protein [Fibularhizoctonia sp. CBS 109695]
MVSLHLSFLLSLFSLACSLPHSPAAFKRAADGCGASSPWTFDSTGHANITLGDRSFVVHIPENYQENDAHAVVLSFHGYGENPQNQELISGLSENGLLLNKKGIIAVYPLGVVGIGRDDGDAPGPAWQGAPYAQSDVDDVAFTKDVVAEVSGNLCVDSGRIYASGKSNGGGFTNILACDSTASSLFAAFALVSAALYAGAYPLSGCTPGDTVPLINFHGLADTIIPFDGQLADKENDAAYVLPNITVYRQDWALRDGCATTVSLSLTHPFTNTTLKEWGCSSTDARAVVRGYTVDGLGHSWPSTLGLDGGVTTFNATTAAILPFFDAHVLP